MGSPTKARVHSTVPAGQETHFDSLHLRDHSTKHIIHNGKGFRIKKSQEEWQMCLLSSPRDKSKNSKRPLVSWMLTRTVSCLALTLSLPSLEWENLFLMVRHQACSLRHLVQLTLHRWSCFSQKKWPEAPMMTIPSLKLLIPSKSTAKSTQKCSDTPFALLETNSPTPKLTTPTLNS